MADSLAAELNEAEAKAWAALGRYKFQMFGYWAAIWVHLNRVGGFNKPNPWRELVQLARAKKPLAVEINCAMGSGKTEFSLRNPEEEG